MSIKRDHATTDLLLTLKTIAEQAKLTGGLFPNAPGRGDWLAVEQQAQAALRRAYDAGLILRN